MIIRNKAGKGRRKKKALAHEFTWEKSDDILMFYRPGPKLVTW